MEKLEYILTHVFTSTRVPARMTDKLLVLGHFNVHHSICTTLLYKKLFTKWKNMYLFSFYSTKCPARFNFQSAKSLDYSVLMYQGTCCNGKNIEKMLNLTQKN